MTTYFMLGFVVGLICGFGSFLLYGMHQLKKARQARNKLVSEIAKKAQDLEEKKDSIKNRLKEAARIAQEQLELRAQAELPSMNAAHSRYKNGLVYEIRELERQKIDILKTIIKDGFDPMITVINEAGAREEIPLSAYINNAELNAADDTTSAPQQPSKEKQDNSEENQPKRVGPFMVHKGGKDDGTTH